MSGHSKWAQIKHKKTITDQKRGQLFSKAGREIAIAVRGGGGNLDTNLKLRQAIEKARSLGMSKETIERTVAKTSGEQGGANLYEFIYEATGPLGLKLIIEGITDNKNRVLAEIKQILNGHGSKLADPGSILWDFERVGILEVGQEDNAALAPDDLELYFIESGASDFRREENGWTVETAPANLENVKKILESKHIKTKEAGYDYKTKTPLQPNAGAKELIIPLLDALTEHNDIQEVYTNLIEE